jgi:uncharacterized protein YdhG (YjbR/CyaY superfamily)
MAKAKPHFQTIDDYINACPDAVQEKLRAIRQLIHEVAPTAEEAIAYQMPTFKLYGNLVHFAAFTHHIGFYPTPSGTDAPIAGLAAYKTGKGTLQFPLDQPLPLSLLRELVEFRVQENLAKQRQKRA